MEALAALVVNAVCIGIVVLFQFHPIAVVTVICGLGGYVGADLGKLWTR